MKLPAQNTITIRTPSSASRRSRAVEVVAPPDDAPVWGATVPDSPTPAGPAGVAFESID
jgi:hypothetical protein